MALIKCPNCGEKISDQAIECPKCGIKMNSLQDTACLKQKSKKKAHKKKGKIFWFIMGFLLGFVAGVIAIIAVSFASVKDEDINNYSSSINNTRYYVGKNDVAVVGAGLGGATVAYGLQQKNYRAYLINGSEQDNRTIPDAKNVLILEGYDGLAGDRSLALEALQRNKQILKTISEIEQKIVLCVASGGGSTGSGNLPYICDILAADSERIVVPIVLMPRKDEPIQKRLNAYNLAKELIDTDGIGAIIFVNNESYDDLKRINAVLVNMLDAFFSDSSASSGSNFDDSEKMKMLKEPGAFVIAMLSDKRAEENKTTTQDMINALTAKNIFLPVNNDGIVGNIGIINQKNNKLDEHELIKAIGTPENIFVGYNGNVNIACAFGLSYPVEYIKKLGQSAVEEQKERIEKRKTISVLDDLNIEEIVIPEVKKKTTKGKRNRISLDFLNSL